MLETKTSSPLSHQHNLNSFAARNSTTCNDPTALKQLRYVKSIFFLLLSLHCRFNLGFFLHVNVINNCAHAGLERTNTEYLS